MRGLNGSARGDERGAVLVFMSVFLVVIVAMAALVVDVGALLDERRQLQNGADAAALAVAQTCAFAVGACDVSDRTEALNLAAANARDGQSGVDAVSYLPPNRVQVTTSTRGGTSNILPSSFAQVLSGVKGTTVRATAAAGWGSVRRATVRPLVIEHCKWVEATRGGTSFGTPTIVYFHEASRSRAAPCATAAGQDTSGGFGWVVDQDDEDNGDCRISAQVEDMLEVKPGVPAPRSCDVAAWVDQTVLLPIFDSIEGGGRSGHDGYHVYGFAEFHVTGFRFPGAAGDRPGVTAGDPAGCSPAASCLRGYFRQFVSPADAVGGPDLGAKSVFLVS